MVTLYQRGEDDTMHGMTKVWGGTNLQFLGALINNKYAEERFFMQCLPDLLMATLFCLILSKGNFPYYSLKVSCVMLFTGFLILLETKTEYKFSQIRKVWGNLKKRYENR